MGEAEAASKLTLHLADVGQTGAWGYPVDWQHREPMLRRKQAGNLVEMLDARACCFDLIMTDGRFRSATLLQALLLAHNTTTVALHDSYRYIDPLGDKRAHSRESFKEARQFYYIVHLVGSLVVLRPKPSALQWAKSGDPEFQKLLELYIVDTMR